MKTPIFVLKLFVIVLLLSGCVGSESTYSSRGASSKGTGNWVPLSGEPKLQYDYAAEICEAKQNLAFRSYQSGNISGSGSGDIDCYTYGFNSISCSRSSSGGKWAGALEWLEESRNRNAAIEVAHAAAKVCMAEYGWRYVK